VILGYLLAGVAIGPCTPGPTASSHSVEVLAEIGVAFLMCALGAELAIAELRRIVGALLALSSTRVAQDPAVVPMIVLLPSKPTGRFHLSRGAAGLAENGRFAFRGLRDQDSNLEPTGYQPDGELNHPTSPSATHLRLRCATYLGRHSGKLDGCTLLV
jgi:Sodium/hydrogen exchanger family